MATKHDHGVKGQATVYPLRQPGAVNPGLKNNLFNPERTEQK